MKESHIALYRKYRPKSFKEVVGQEKAIELLENAIKQKKVSHAYLFSGGRGTGKTTVARIVARDLGTNDEDIIEIDAASNRGIEEIRELREAVRTAPFSSPYKVYILDEAHMLTKEAANALLKTLEEPPSHVIFILATTDPQKLPQTIISRTQKIAFEEPDLETLAKQIAFVAKEEGFSLSEESALLVARHSRGSYRDALSLLEQVLSVSSKKVSHEDVVLRLGEPDSELVFLLIRSLCEKDAKAVVSNIKKLSSHNASALRIYDECLVFLRNALLVRVGVRPETKDESLLLQYKELATNHPHVIASKTLLELLKGRELLEISGAHSFIAMEAVFLSLIEV